MRRKCGFAISKTETILDTALHSERRDIRQELSFKSPKCERIERFVVADFRLSHRNIDVQRSESARKAANGEKRPFSVIRFDALARSVSDYTDTSSL